MIKKKMYDILGIKSVIMEEMYEKTDSEKKEIREVKEIMSSKEKFLENIWGVTFAFKCYSKNMNPKNLVFLKLIVRII